MYKTLIQLVVMVVAGVFVVGSSSGRRSSMKRSKKGVFSSEQLKKCRSGESQHCDYLAQLYIKYGHYNQARKWYKAGCSFGGASSCYRLGKFLLSGRGGELNVELAFEYFRQACSLQNYLDSCHMLATHKARRKAVAKRRKACALYGLPETATDAEIHQAYLAREKRRKAEERFALCLKIPSGRRDFRDLYKVFSHINRCVIKLKKHSGTKKVVKKLEIIMIKLYPLISNICKQLRSFVFRRIRVGRRIWQGRSAIQFNLCLRMLQYFRSKGINVNKIKRLVLRRCKALGGSCREVRRQVTPKARRNSRKRGRTLVCSRGNNSYWCMVERAKKMQRRAGLRRTARRKQKRANAVLLMQMDSKRLSAIKRRNMAKVRRRCRKLKPVCGGKYVYIRNRTNYSRDVTLCYYSSSDKRWYTSTTYALAHTITRTSKYVSCTYFHYFHVCGCN